MQCAKHLFLFLSVLPGLHASGQALDEARTETFKRPADAIVRLLTTPAPPTPLVHAPSGNVALLVEDTVISQKRLMTPRVALAGWRLDPVTGIVGIEPMVREIRILRNVGSGSNPDESPHIWTPGGQGRWDYVEFSPEGHSLAALRVETGKPSELWVFDIATGRAKKLTDKVSAVWGKPCEWRGEASLLCRIKPKKPPALPANNEKGLVVFDHPGGKLPTRTYSLLLETANDDAIFTHHYSVALAQISLKGKVTRLRVTPGLIRQFEPSPNGEYVLLRRIEAPFPRLVPARRFPTRYEVWHVDAAEPRYTSTVTGFGIAEEEDASGADLKSIEWKPDAPATAGYVYRSHIDEDTSSYEWRTLKAPFNGSPDVLAHSATPIRAFGWTSMGTPWYQSREAQGESAFWLLDQASPRKVWQGDRADRYTSPGKALRVQGQRGPVLEYEGKIFLIGDGLSDEGASPFLDEVELATGSIQRLYQSEAGVFEPVLAVLNPEKPLWLTRRETDVLAPQLQVRDGHRAQQLYQIEDPYPQLAQVERRQLSYTRRDGVALNATLYLPAERSAGKPLPTLIWIYPREYEAAEQAEQLDARPFQYHRIIGPSAIAAVLEGYAVVVRPTVPILSTEDGNGYLPQLVSSTDALVEYLVAEGISDADRVAIGGRSYGAFSTANLLIHSQKFASGIAMSGAYNRTLTPFGFQHEKRDFWEATEYYTSVSPFFYADKIKRPLLLVHGGEDPNPGTPKIQARRFFHALVGEGAITRYVELPGEPHHYRGEETVLHATWEMLNWLDMTIGPKSPKARN